jgi:hypothetical protein
MTPPSENASRLLPTSRDVDHEVCGVIVLRRSGTELLTVLRESGMKLPAIVIPRYQRLAESVNQEVQVQLGITAYCLFSIDIPAIDVGLCLYQVMEIRDENQPTPQQFMWTLIGQLDEAAISEEEFSATSSAMRELHSYASGLAVGPFGRPGWIEELTWWIEREIGHLGLRLSGGIRQFNASPTFALLRFETNGPAVWFKAVGKPNLREFPITVALSRMLPAFVPTLIAAHPSLHGWLTMECAGLTLSEVDGTRAWVQTAETLAELQIQSIRVTDKLLEAGCTDLRVVRLMEQVDPFMEVMAKVMNRQEKSSPRVLEGDELLRLGIHIKQAAFEWTLLNVPDTLGHLDLNPGNIVIKGESCVFLDWAESFVGPPFLTFQYLCAHHRRTSSQSDASERRLAEHYARRWKAVISPEAIAEGQALAGLLAPFTYAVGTGMWREIGDDPVSKSAAFFRSLTRRMYSESQMLRQRRHTCSRS